MKRIYVVDDEESIRDLVRAYLTRAGYEVEAFATGDKLLKVFRDNPADLVVLDIMMPGTDGLAVCSFIRANSSIPIIIISAKSGEWDKVSALKLGCNDYLVKPFSPVELVARVRNLLHYHDNKERDKKSVAITYGDIEMIPQLREIRIGGQIVSLTLMEYDFLLYLFRNRHTAISREELLQTVWRVCSDVDSRMVDNMVKRIRKKITAAGSNVTIATLRGYGYRLEGGEDA